MTTSDLVDRLAAHRIIGAAPRAELEWLAAHGHVRTYAKGEVARPKGDPVVELWVVLAGRASIRVNRGAGARKIMEWRAGDVSGLLPYSRLSVAPGEVLAEEPTEVFMVNREDFPEMIATCHELTGLLVHVMLDRTRHFTSTDLHDEKMIALGRLAAGLAHELNNPASAAVRSAKGLARCLAEASESARALGAAQASASELAAIEELAKMCAESDVRSVRSPIEQADREDAIAEWLSSRGADVTVAQPLAESEVSFAELDRLSEALNPERRDLALRWIAADCLARKLVSEIESATARIHGLVSAVKRFTYLDQAAAPKPVDIGQDLRDTLAVLKSKARSKSVGIRLDLDPNLPRIEAFGGELNQVWINLIDNALDAVPESGHVDVTANVHDHHVVISVIDDGPGIPADIRDRIFDPFFTTKPVGHGTGLGLDVARRLVLRHDGEIEVDSRPGRTEFRVTLPVDRVAVPAGSHEH